MKIEIQVISTEIIHPSSPIPKDVSNNYKLSFMDQLKAPALMPLTFFYKATGNNHLKKSEISNHLKISLSKTLSLYYPFTGRIVDNSYVHDDQGIKYVEAEANCKLSEVIINKPIPQELDKFFPINIYDVAEVCLVIQVTFFSCGGLSIAASVSHKICDAWSISLFINSWASISRGKQYHVGQSPILEGATLFPPRDLGGLGYDPRREMLRLSKNQVTNKRFLFTSSKISELRDIYTTTTRATRIEALSAFIWTRFMASTQTKDNLKRKFNLLFPVNIRKRAVPPLSDDLFGNLIQAAIPLFDGEEEGTSKNGLVEKVRESIGRIDGDYVNKLREGGQSINDTEKKLMNSELEHFVFASLCRLPIYEADFGGGKPIWITIGSSFKKNIVTFLDSASGGGIDAWIALKSEDMAKFEADQEFLAYATT